MHACVKNEEKMKEGENTTQQIIHGYLNMVGIKKVPPFYPYYVRSLKKKWRTDIERAMNGTDCSVCIPVSVFWYGQAYARACSFIQLRFATQGPAGENK